MNITHHIVSMKRGQTSGSSSPMWRCTTKDGERVNVFQHSDPARNSFALFDAAGYSRYMTEMALDEEITWNEFPIPVELAKDGNWWKVIAVDEIQDTRPDGKFKPDPSLARILAIDWAEYVFSASPYDFIILDTETTGTGNDAEIVSIAAITSDGESVLDLLLKPEHPERLANGSGAVNGITSEMVATAPHVPDVYSQIYGALAGEHIIVWNADFDWPLLERTCYRYGFVPPYPASVTCAMKMFARWHGEWNQQKNDWQFKGLQYAAERLGVLPYQAHSALGDCRTTRDVIRAMAGAYMPAADGEE